jgi:putative ABC transport system permease protein
VTEEERLGSNRVVVLSHELWVRRFGADKGIIGRNLTLNNEQYSVVGIVPADFRFYTKTDVWTPLAFDVEEESARNSSYLEVVARRKAGVSLEQARIDADNITTAFINNPNSKLHARLTPPKDLLIREVRPMLLLLLSAVGFVLLIACANMANLSLARGTVRRRELAVRTALGASRIRVVKQLLIESALLAFAGGAVGLLAANWSIKFLAMGLPEYLADVVLLQIDTTTLAFTIGVSLLTTFLFGFIPALQLSRVDLNKELKESGRTTITRSRFRSALVVTEIALAMITLVGAGLMLKSFWKLLHVDPGYKAEGVLTAQIDPSGESYKELPQINAFYNELLARVSRLPDVTHAAIINSLNASTNISVAEHPPVPPEQQKSAQMNQVSEDYFGAMGIPLRAGRLFNDRDVKTAPPVVIIDDSLARREFQGENPVGKHLKFWDKSWEVVGVVGGARYWRLTDDPAPQMYFSHLQVNWRSMSLIVSTDSGNPMSLVGPIRAQLASIDKNQPVHSFKTLESTVSSLIAPQRFTTSLLTSFAALAAVLSAIGIYGVISYSVTQSTRDIGVRIALGARPNNVLRMVVGNGIALAGVGVLLGLAGSYALTRLMTSLLFEVQPTDRMVFAIVSLGLLLVALIACYIPARRATKVDPLVALRCE